MLLLCVQPRSIRNVLPLKLYIADFLKLHLFKDYFFFVKIKYFFLRIFFLKNNA